MVPDYKYLLDGNFSPDSRVWIYQSNRIFLINEALEIEDILNNFIKEWKSHGTPVKGSAHLLFGRFIVLLADEKATGVSGCSTDSSVRMIKEIEQQFNVNLFEREMLAFVVNDKIQLLPFPQLQYAFDNNFITADTLYFNNTVQTKEELETQWIIPVKESWLKNRLKLKAEG
jgi:hypothetical protein